MALVIVGYDGSPDAERAIDFTAARLRPASARGVTVWEPVLTGVHASPTVVTPAQLSPEDDRRLEEAAREIADHGAARARAAGLHVKAETRSGVGPGQTAEILLDVAEQHDADLVVVGRRGMGRVKAALLGSVSDAAVRDRRFPRARGPERARVARRGGPRADRPGARAMPDRRGSAA